jgi:hypothetical protein
MSAEKRALDKMKGNKETDRSEDSNIERKVEVRREEDMQSKRPLGEDTFDQLSGSRYSGEDTARIEYPALSKSTEEITNPNNDDNDVVERDSLESNRLVSPEWIKQREVYSSDAEAIAMAKKLSLLENPDGTADVEDEIYAEDKIYAEAKQQSEIYDRRDAATTSGVDLRSSRNVKSSSDRPHLGVNHERYEESIGSNRIPTRREAFENLDMRVAGYGDRADSVIDKRSGTSEHYDRRTTETTDYIDSRSRRDVESRIDNSRLRFDDRSEHEGSATSRPLTSRTRESYELEFRQTKKDMEDRERVSKERMLQLRTYGSEEEALRAATLLSLGGTCDVMPTCRLKYISFLNIILFVIADPASVPSRTPKYYDSNVLSPSSSNNTTSKTRHASAPRMRDPPAKPSHQEWYMQRQMFSNHDDAVKAATDLSLGDRIVFCIFVLYNDSFRR